MRQRRVSQGLSPPAKADLNAREPMAAPY